MLRVRQKLVEHRAQSEDDVATVVDLIEERMNLSATALNSGVLSPIDKARGSRNSCSALANRLLHGTQQGTLTRWTFGRLSGNQLAGGTWSSLSDSRSLQ